MVERNDGLKCITPIGMDANKVAHDATPSGRDPARRQERPDSHTASDGTTPLSNAGGSIGT